MTMLTGIMIDFDCAVAACRPCRPVSARSFVSLRAMALVAVMGCAGALHAAISPDALSTTTLVVNASSSWTAVDAKAPDQFYYKFTAEAVVQTGGMRYYQYKQFYYRLEPQSGTNLVLYSPYSETTAPPVIVRHDTPPVPSNVLVTLDFLTESLPKPAGTIQSGARNDELFVYIDSMALDADGQPDPNAPALSDTLGVSDPLERFNRVMFTADGAMYTYFFRPIGKGYAYVVPSYARRGISRMDYNIQMPKRVINTALQGKFKGTGIEFSRFMINTTLGLVGFFDPAKNWFGLETYDVDTGQTFAHWGMGPGFFFYLPVITGPTTLRDGIGQIFDDSLDPRGYTVFFIGTGVKILMKFNNLTMKMNEVDRLKAENLDPYNVTRDMWYLMRSSKVAE